MEDQSINFKVNEIELSQILPLLLAHSIKLSELLHFLSLSVLITKVEL